MRRMSRTQSGFTLVELLVTVILIVLVVGMAVPVAGTMDEDDRTDGILALVRTARLAVRRHYADTGRLAVECRESRGRSLHGLTSGQGVPGWAGPYLRGDWSLERLGVTGWEIRADFASGPCRPWGECFLVGSERVVRLTGVGQYLAVTGIDREAALTIDQAIDGPGSEDWVRHGEVQWRDARGGTLMILLMDV